MRNDDDNDGKERAKNETNHVHCEVGGSSPYVPALHGSVGELTLPVEYHPLATSTTDDPPTPTTWPKEGGSHLTCPGFFEKNDTGQSLHFERPFSSWKYPGIHFVHRVEPDKSLWRPTLQDMQWSCPVVLVNIPGEQVSHLDFAIFELKNPGLHGRQNACPSKFWYFPFSQEMQDASDFALIWTFCFPALQAMHEVFVLAPVLSLQVPGRHELHVESLEALSAALHFPAAHLTHEDSPEAPEFTLNFPRPQILHALCWEVPRFSSPYWPRGQFLHESDVLELVYCPSSHALHASSWLEMLV